MEFVFKAAELLFLACGVMLIGATFIAGYVFIEATIVSFFPLLESKENEFKRQMIAYFILCLFTVLFLRFANAL